MTLAVANSKGIFLSTGSMTNFPEYSFSSASKIASLTGTLVHRDVTLKEITTSSCSRKKLIDKFNLIC